MPGGGVPVELLVLGPWDELPLFLAFLSPLSLQGDRSTYREIWRGVDGYILLVWGGDEVGLPNSGGTEIAIIGDSIGTDTISCLSFWAAMRFFDLEIEEGSARGLYSKIEKGLEQSIDGAGIFSKIP